MDFCVTNRTVGTTVRSLPGSELEHDFHPFHPWQFLIADGHVMICLKEGKLSINNPGPLSRSSRAMF